MAGLGIGDELSDDHLSQPPIVRYTFTKNNNLERNSRDNLPKLVMSSMFPRGKLKDGTQMDTLSIIAGMINKLDGKYVACIRYKSACGKPDTQFGLTGKPLFGESCNHGAKMELEEEMGVTVSSDSIGKGHIVELENDNYVTYFVVPAKQLSAYEKGESKEEVVVKHVVKHVEKRRSDRKNKIMCIVVGELDEFEQLFGKVSARRHASDTDSISGVDIILVDELKKIIRKMEKVPDTQSFVPWKFHVHVSKS